jgi:hypothetical protein
MHQATRVSRRRMITRRGPLTAVALLAAALTIALSATALAAQPKAGKRYSGFTSQPKFMGFSAPVTFKVSATGAKLAGFTYGSFGCFGAGGFKPGVNPYTGAFLIPVGTVPVSSSGKFSVKNAKSRHTFTGKFGETILTTAQVSGRFATARTATGTISFTQTGIPKHGKSISCGPVKLTFRVKTK